MPIDTVDLVRDLNKQEYSATSKKIMEAAVTIVKNENGLLPIINNCPSKKDAVDCWNRQAAGNRRCFYTVR